jgi:secreted PhoX family phosphatase
MIRTGDLTTPRREFPIATVDRRSFIRRSAGIAGSAMIPASMSGLLAACTEQDPTGAVVPRTSSLVQARRGGGGYGDLVNDTGVLLLPEDFRVQTFGVVGEPMSDGVLTPIAHDGMAAFPWFGGRIRLVRNQEDRNPPGTLVLSTSNAYDPLAGAGTTTIELDVDFGDGDGELEIDDLRHPTITVVKSFVSLAGTWVNCAGGPTPWHSWLTCEETVAGVSEGFSKTHGWVFDVPASANRAVVPVPLKAMGRFSHEAIAVDFRTGIVYETEDNGFPPGSGFFRFLPNRLGDLARGGKLQMARIKGSPKLELWRGSTIGINVGEVFDVDWVDIPVVDPDPNDEMLEDDRLAGVFMQGYDKGGAVFNRLEGCWYGDSSIYFHDTRGGAAQRGHVWRYIPGHRHNDGGKLVLLFESPGVDVLDSPDNITVSPRGGLVLCEDGGGTQFLRGLTQHGEIFSLAQNTLNGSEFAGAVFSPLGQILFCNLQGATAGDAAVTGANVATRGLTMAITGPWRRGAL